ncbi:unnamed protein product [Phytomonas sp. Hart1]|nr:unnamed protein product [Phytomonas sp. Hart1]|eukprot:CCW67292.1 unnamed protein product [Phytomonas sp. isolate Hart1]
MKGILLTSKIALNPILKANIKKAKLDEILRVDHAGEVAAVRIASHQLAWMSPLDDAVPIVNEILDDELVHEKVMNDLVNQYDIKTTKLDPLFKLAAFILGAGTAVIGKEAMMCCHAAVEVTIYDHYNEQLREMEILDQAIEDMKETEGEVKEWNSIKDTVAKFRDEEKHHQELGEQNGADQAPAYPLLYNTIRLACKVGVSLAKKI